VTVVVGSASEGDSTIAADDDDEARFSYDDDDDDDLDDDKEEGDNDAMIREETTHDEVSHALHKNNLNVDMKTFSSEDDAEIGNTLYPDDVYASSPGKRDGKESPELERSPSTPDKHLAVSPPAFDARNSVLREPAGSFSEPFGSSVAQLESFVASVVSAERKRPATFREPCSPPTPATRGVPASPQLAPVVCRPRHSKVAKTTPRTFKSPTSMSQSTTGGRINRTSRGPAHVNLPPSFLGPPPPGQPAVDQPLDLSTKSRRESQYLSPDVVSAGPSSLLSLERQFGKGSAIFERIGTKAWAAPYCAAALRLGVQSLAFSGGLGLVSPPSPSTSRRLTPGRPSKDRDTVAYPLVARQQPPAVSPGATTADVTALLPWAQPPDSKRISTTTTSTTSGMPSSPHVHTNLRCGCGASMDSLFALTVILPLSLLSK